MVEIDNFEKVDYLFKFIIIGDTGVGKSCILNQYLRGKCKYSDYLEYMMSAVIKDEFFMVLYMSYNSISHVYS